jgi:hypothetical protein
MHRVSWIAALAAVSLGLAGCGGGDTCNTLSGAAGACGNTSGGQPVPTSLTVSSAPATIPSDGSATATITAIAKDANNAALSGVTVVFAADNGATVTTTQGTTDSTGTAKGTLSVGSAAAGTTVDVTATAGSVTGKTTVAVTNAKKTLTLLTSSPTIPSDNSSGATISAIVKDANNNLLAGVPVSFQVTSGAIVPVQTTAGAGASVAAGTTDANGMAQATVTTPGDPSNRTLTVNATAGSATAQVNIAVTGTTVTLTGPATLVLNNTANFTVLVSNSSGKGIANTPVTVSSANNNTLSASSLVTDANGRATFTVKGAAGGNDTITATSLGLTQTASLAVSAQSFNITAPANGTNVVLGNSQQLTVTWTNNGAPVVGQPVTFVATRGTVVPSTPVNTDANGHASASISSSSGGPSIVQASGSSVSAQLNLQFVANNPSQIAVQAGPNTVAIQGQSTILATVRDAQNNLVQGATVNFEVVSDPTNGGLSSASGVTDAQGRAQTVYTAGNSSSGANGVTVSATVAASSITASTTLTVGGQAVGLLFGTGNTIDVGQGPAVYQVTYSVFASDSHGAPLPNQPITFSVLPVAYGKGVMAGCPGGTSWGPSYSTGGGDTFAYTGPGLLNGAQMCRNEDTDYNGNIASLDSGTPGTCVDLVSGQTITSHVKDNNCNGQLDPSTVATVSPASGVTDATGRLDVKITYNRDHAYWALVTLIASTTVAGTQSSTSTTFTLQGAAADYACSTGPPGPVSPYGKAATCSDPR